MSEALIGYEKVHSDLDKLDKKLANKIIRTGLRAGGKIWQAAARGEAPEDSGRTKRNIKVRAGKRTKTSQSITVGISDKDYTGEAFYASFVLFGHRVGPRALGDGRVLVPPNNFLKRTFDQTSEAAANRAVEVMAEMIKDNK